MQSDARQGIERVVNMFGSCKISLARLFAIAATVAGLSMGSSAQAQNLITNGSFENFAGANLSSQQLLQTGGTGTAYSGWSTTSGYGFIVTPNQAINGFNGPSGFLQLWSPNGTGVTGNGGSGSVAITASPDGGSFFTTDPIYPTTTGVLTTTVTGLIVGSTYTLSFYQAAGQQKGFDAFSGFTNTWNVKATDSNNQVDLNQNAAGMNVANHSFTGWTQVTMAVVATTASMTLQFFASSSLNAGQPPFAMLDGVSLTKNASTAVPEPTAMLLLGSAVAGLFGARRMRERR